MKVKLKYFVNLSGFISLHTDSVWETICDAGPSLGEKILCSKSHPPTKMKIVQNFGFELTKNSLLPFPQKWKLSRTLNLSLPRIPPPHTPENENCSRL